MGVRVRQTDLSVMGVRVNVQQIEIEMRHLPAVDRFKRYAR